MSQPAAPGHVSSVATSRLHRILLRIAAVAVLGLALVGALLPGTPGRWLDAVAVTLVIAVPLLRVATLLVEFAREHDWRFVVASGALLVVVGVGAVLA